MIAVVALTLLPLTIYCLVLALVNRRRYPVVVSGRWDFLGTLFGASGFLLFAGPYVLDSLNDRWRDHWLFHEAGAANPIGDAGHLLWMCVRISYAVVVLAAAGFLLWRRRRVLSVYNVTPDAVPEVVAQVLDGLDLSWERSGERYFRLSTKGCPSTGTNGAATAYSESAAVAEAGGRPVLAILASHAGVAERIPLLELDLFRALHHVSIHWAKEADSVRPRAEEELRRALAEIPTLANPAAFWFTSFAVGLFGVLTLVFTSWIILLALAGIRAL